MTGDSLFRKWSGTDALRSILDIQQEKDVGSQGKVVPVQVFSRSFAFMLSELAGFHPRTPAL